MIAQSYLICATQRTGSTLLCEALRQSGRIGDPQEYFEYLIQTGLPRQPAQYFISGDENERNTGDVVKLLGSPKLRMDLERVKCQQRHPYQLYVSQVVVRGASSNGIFGAKIMWDHLPDFMERLTGDADLSSSDRVNSCLQRVFPDLKYIYVTRRDKLRQAVSLWKAIQTQQWRLDSRAMDAKAWRVPIFDFGAIEYLHCRLVEHDLNWQRLFAGAHIEPLVLCYEEFASDPKRAFIQVAQFLGLQDAKRRFVPPMMIRQSNLQSEGWIERYRRISRSKWHKRTSVC